MSHLHLRAVQVLRAFGKQSHPHVKDCSPALHHALWAGSEVQVLSLLRNSSQ